MLRVVALLQRPLGVGQLAEALHPVHGDGVGVVVVVEGVEGGVPGPGARRHGGPTHNEEV